MIALATPTAADAAALTATATESFLETFAHLYVQADIDSFVATTFGPAGLPAQIGDPRYDIRIHRDAGRITGFAKLGPLDLPVADPPEGSVELKQLYVLKPWQGVGVAAALMDWAMAEARARDAPAVYLSVYSDNIRAQRFYTRYGFREIGRNPYRVGNQIDDDRVWECRF